jgi:hypothetical protein
METSVKAVVTIAAAAAAAVARIMQHEFAWMDVSSHGGI